MMRWLIRALASLVVLVLLLGLMVVLMPKDAVLDLAARKFTEATGRQLQIGRGAKVAIWPVLGVSAGPVRLANAGWGSEPDMLVADRIDIGLDPLALLDGRIVIRRVELARPELLLERGVDGRGNWLIRAPGPADAAEPSGEAPDVTLGDIQIRDGRLRFVDHGDPTRAVDLTALDLALLLPGGETPARISAKALLAGQPLSVQAESGTLPELLAGRSGDLDLAVTAGGNSLRFAGRAGLSPAMAEGQIDTRLTDRPALAALSGHALPALPEGLGARGIALKGALTLTPEGSLHLREAALEADETRLSLDLDLTPGTDRPRLVARLGAEALRLPRPPDGGDGGAAPAGWSDAPIDLSGLHALDAEIALTTRALSLGDLGFGPVKARAGLEAGRMVVDLTEAALHGGSARGQIVVNARKGLSASADLTLSGIDLQALLTEIAGTARLAGDGDLRLKLLASGPSQAALIQSLKGSVGVVLGKGEVLGLDIAGMLRTMDPGYVGEGRKTIFDGLSVTGQIDKGILRSEDLAISDNLFHAGGRGTVDLGARTVDYRLLPRLAPKADGSGGLEVPVLIKGPWAAPKVRLDLEWLARERAKAEAARAEALAKQRLEELAQDKLGVAPQGTESLEDAAKRRAREAVEAETGRILDRILKGN